MIWRNPVTLSDPLFDLAVPTLADQDAVWDSRDTDREFPGVSPVVHRLRVEFPHCARRWRGRGIHRGASVVRAA